MASSRLRSCPNLASSACSGMQIHGYGCAGLGPLGHGLACLELEAGDSSVRSFVSVQGSLAMFPIWRYGTEEQKQRWLAAMATGATIGCFGLSEPEAGSDPASMRTHARKDGGDWVIEGTKMWITNGGIADVSVVWAQTEGGIRAFIVPRGTTGLSATNLQRKLSIRASVTSELVFDNCRVPDDASLPGAVGLRAALSCLDEARFSIVWGALGAARACFEAALSYALERRQFGKPIAAFQLTQAKLADMAVELEKGLLLAYQLARHEGGGAAAPSK